MYALQLTHLLPTDWRSGQCDRCGSHGDVIPELGANAEQVCRSCLLQALERDYREYRLLLEQSRLTA